MMNEINDDVQEETLPEVDMVAKVVVRNYPAGARSNFPPGKEFVWQVLRFAGEKEVVQDELLIDIMSNLSDLYKEGCITTHEAASTDEPQDRREKIIFAHEVVEYLIRMRGQYKTADEFLRS